MPVFELLSKRLQAGLLLVHGSEGFDVTLRNSVSERLATVHVKNLFLARRRLLWQVGAIRPLVDADVAIMELNPRVLSTWLALLARRARRKPSVLWGHAWSRAGKGAATNVLRRAIRKLADATLAYSATEARELRQLTPGANVVAVPNALYSRGLMQSVVADDVGSAFVFVGRLVPAKKPALLLEAFAEARRSLPAGASLILVGEGPLRQELEGRVATLGVQSQVTFRGHVNDWQGLQRIYGEALASVSPGYVGLSLIQSLSFGIPMIIARDEPHSPEMEAADEGRNALLFESDDKDSLVAAMHEAWHRREFWRAQRSDIAQSCARHYSIDSMVDQILLALDAVTGDAPSPTACGQDDSRREEAM